jgi:hypothetical protein
VDSGSDFKENDRFFHDEGPVSQITIENRMADLIKAPSTIPSESGSIIVSSKGGGRRWTASWTMEPAEWQGQKTIRFTERGQGRISPFTREVRWSLEAVWSAATSLQPLDTEKMITSPTGEWLASERKHFDVKAGTVRFERQSSDSRSDVKTISIPADTLAVEGIAGVLRFAALDRPFPAHLLSNEPNLYSVTFENRGRERVKTPAGAFDAYRIEVVPHVGVMNLFRSFFPKTYFWFTVAAPHFWVRYEGLENGRGTPEIVMELNTYQP